MPPTKAGYAIPKPTDYRGAFKAMEERVTAPLSLGEELKMRNITNVPKPKPKPKRKPKGKKKPTKKKLIKKPPTARTKQTARVIDKAKDLHGNTVVKVRNNEGVLQTFTLQQGANKPTGAKAKRIERRTSTDTRSETRISRRQI